MAESSKIGWLNGPGLTQRGVALSGGLALVASLFAFAPILPLPAFWQMLKTQAAAPNSTWAGHLEAPGADGAAGGRPLTSASYTTGFNNSAALPLPAAAPAKIAVEDPNACPPDLNCTFRPRLNAVLPPPRPPMVASRAPGAQTPAHRVAALQQPASQPPEKLQTPNKPQPTPMQQAENKPKGLARWLPHLPPARTLLRPFTFVANAVGGLIPKL
ncbi:hypothetical protein CWB41_12475 [Methylovirgula ligni]|uniref:Uncharacterized protein n=1 Tax=Methylovirgula ligni TaxID=569860 RepID=A0A3D9YTJ3_9HYPH|nr:hypothetical protein [Methylovirgula ligni]QAY96445.1 hypothetical protein CWB41_12475 [Methylovirgula ligni]REF85824.1 hypothetical protein DES32_1860 [Methylovirgula ligni]